MLPSLPNKVSKLEIQVDVIYQCLYLHKFLYFLSLVHHYRILYFVLLFSSTGELKIQTLQWKFKVRSLKKPTNHETGEQWSILFFFLTRLVQNILLFYQQISANFNSNTYFNVIYFLLLESSVLIKIVLNNYLLAKRFTVQLKEEKKAMTKRERFISNI